MKKYRLLALVLVLALLTGCAGAHSIETTPDDLSTEVSTGQAGTTTCTEVDLPIEPLPTKEPQTCIVIPVPEEEALWTFSHNLLLQSMEKENPVLSPVSAYLALGMAGMGAKEETLREMRLAMGNEMQEIAEDIMEELVQVSEPNPGVGYDLRLANSAWIREGLEVNKSWLNNIEKFYRAEHFQRDLTTNKTMKEINEWISLRTEGLIKDFLSEPLSGDTELALFNTIYFYGKWRNPFEKEATRKEEFTLADGKTETVDMMNQYRERHLYFSENGYDGVVLPYRGEDMAFVAIKPNAGQSVRELFESLTQKDLEKILDVEDYAMINLKMPKFDITFDQILNESLQNMGIRSAFDKNLADFSGMSKNGTRDFFISLVRQKAVIKVDEEGTEAAAVTAVMMEGMAAEMPADPIDVYFDEPFVYMLVNTDEEIPLFMGILDNPNAK